MTIQTTAGGLYNAAEDLIGRNLTNGRADNIAVIDSGGRYTYAEINSRARTFANVLTELGVQAEQRIVLCLHDTVDFPTCFLGAILAGVVPIPINTRLTETTARDTWVFIDDCHMTDEGNRLCAENIFDLVKQ